MPTIILGGGIIGSSVAYYLTTNRVQEQEQEQIHIVEPSELFNCASGYAAGFLAKDWFAGSVAPLGELSFNLHNELAIQNGGAQKWGYMKGSAFSLDTVAVSLGSSHSRVRGDDWLRHGTSRAEASRGGSTVGEEGDTPGWLTRQQGGVLEKISDIDTAQVYVEFTFFISLFLLIIAVI